jgi:arabinoxylan arabinofuranohydrolase
MKTKNSISSPALLAQPKTASLNLKMFLGIAFVVATATGTNCFAINPIIQTIYTADPAPVVQDGVCYLYVDHDEDKLVNNFFTMKDWRCFTSTDMVNWTDHGVVASLRNFKWAGSGWGGGFENGAWALQTIERDGKWYMYCPLQGRGIGVLVSTNGSFGPFTDPIGKPLIGGQYDSIDPTVFIDDDGQPREITKSGGLGSPTGSISRGQAYLCWGNPRCWYVKLNKDMISYDTSIGDHGLVVQDMTVEAFGKRSKTDRPTTYEEGPWLYKRNALYYLIFAAGPIPEHIGYSTGPSPTGPWKYGGVVMPTEGRSFTDHPGVVDYKGHTYLFYHNGALPGGGGFHRSVCVDEMKFNPDGSIVQMTMTKQGVVPVGTLNPYQRVEAETIAWESGVKTAKNADVGVFVTDIRNGAYIRVCAVDFGDKGASKFLASVASVTKGGAIELRLDGETGPLIGTLKVKPTGALNKWKTQSCRVKGAKGVHDLYFKFTGDSSPLMNFDWWKFNK